MFRLSLELKKFPNVTLYIIHNKTLTAINIWYFGCNYLFRSTL